MLGAAPVMTLTSPGPDRGLENPCAKSLYFHSVSCVTRAVVLVCLHLAGVISSSSHWAWVSIKRIKFAYLRQVILITENIPLPKFARIIPDKFPPKLFIFDEGQILCSKSFRLPPIFTSNFNKILSERKNPNPYQGEVWAMRRDWGGKMSYECGRAVQHSQHSSSMFCPRLLQSTWDGVRCVV